MDSIAINLYYVPAVISMLLAMFLLTGHRAYDSATGLASVSNSIRGLFWAAVCLVCLYKAGFF